MHYFFLVLSAFILPRNTIENRTLKVVYLLTNYKSSHTSLPKIKIDKVDKNGNPIKINGLPDSISLNDMGAFRFTIDLEATADEKSLKLKETVNHPGVRGDATTYYFYSNQQWYKNEFREIYPTFDVTYTKTEDQKLILNYLCTRYIMKRLDNGKNYEVWATKELPSTLLPLPGVRAFPYAALEVTDLSGLWTKKATQIEFF